MTNFQIIRRILIHCRGGSSIGTAYDRVARETGLPHGDVVSAYLAAHNRRCRDLMVTPRGWRRMVKGLEEMRERHPGMFRLRESA